ncbi:NAD(P)-dependent oxidoreductase [Enterococcus sp. DIV0876]|uniref:NAD(P)-dependent oxidoreductase n=1 Tax=Enterococcus sp. DIV0876 TaxID=2774633 RepID=UPI003D2FD94C
MRLIYYGVSEEEIPYIERWRFIHKTPVTIVSEGLSQKNIHLAAGHDGICLYPSVDMRHDEYLYQQLHHMGMQQLSIKSTGVDGVNFDWAKKYQLTVTNVPAYSPTSVGHFAVMSILMALRNIPSMVKGHLDRRSVIGRELQDVTVGILGTGRIGAVVAEVIHHMGGRVIATSRSENPRLKTCVDYVSFETLVASSDVLSIHIPLTQASEALFSPAVLAQMKPDSWIVNTARGGIIDTEALIFALRQGRLGGAVLDALANEERYFAVGWNQNPYFQPLDQLPNVLLTPHIAYYTHLAVQEIAETALNNAREILLAGESANTIAL